MWHNIWAHTIVELLLRSNKNTYLQERLFKKASNSPSNDCNTSYEDKLLKLMFCMINGSICKLYKQDLNVSSEG